MSSREIMMDGELYQAVVEGDVEKALRQTCQCLIREKWQPLQETWVRLMNVYGERIYHFQQTPLFYQLAKELSAILTQDDLPVKQALSFTTKLLLVYKRPSMTPRAKNKTTLQKLRSKVISYFPLDAQLTRSGKQKFQRFLPTDPEESAFAERIIVGLLQLCESNSPPEDLKDALEYLARKKLVLYTAPTLKPIVGAEDPIMSPPPPLDDREDLVEYIWMLLKVIKPLSFDELLNKLYYYEYRPSYKNMRLGFLYAMAYVSENSATSCEPVWNQTEHVFLNRVYESSLELWKESKNQLTKPMKGGFQSRDYAEGDDYANDDEWNEWDEPGNCRITNGMDALDVLSFVPKASDASGSSSPPYLAASSRPDPVQTKKVAKVIHISKGKGRNRLIQRQENYKLNTHVDLDDEEDGYGDGDTQARNGETRARTDNKTIRTMALNFIPKQIDDTQNIMKGNKDKQKQIDKHKDRNGASNHHSSGNRRIHIGETRSRIQDPYGSEDSL